MLKRIAFLVGLIAFVFMVSFPLFAQEAAQHPAKTLASVTALTKHVATSNHAILPREHARLANTAALGAALHLARARAREASYARMRILMAFAMNLETTP